MSNLPPLFHKARTGAIHSWRVWTDGSIIISEHGQVDGIKILSQKAATSKNVGRSNQTGAEQQAVIEAAAMYKFKLDRKYSLTPEEAKEDVLLPMLAQPYEKREKTTKFPLMEQIKYNGVRATAFWSEDRVVLQSRQGKEWKATTHLNKELESILPKGTTLDGEVYLHGKSLQWINSRTKKVQPGTELLNYVVYDMPEVKGDDELPGIERQQSLEDFFEGVPDDYHIKPVKYGWVNTKTEMMSKHDEYVAQGYEGLIARVPSAVYEWGHRSPMLLKVKVFEDQEFTIVGHTEGTGNETGLVIWICKNDINDLIFETRPCGTHGERKELFGRAEDWYGQQLTVRFIGRNESGIPNHAIGHAIRLEEDL
jgi:DNA ligase-1